MGNTQRQINTIINQIQIAVLKPQTDVHAGVAGEKFRHQRVNHKTPDGFWHAEGQFSLSHLLRTAGGVHRQARRFQHLLRVRIHRFAGITQA